jgi:hypothetical protein
VATNPLVPVIGMDMICEWFVIEFRRRISTQHLGALVGVFQNIVLNDEYCVVGIFNKSTIFLFRLLQDIFRFFSFVNIAASGINKKILPERSWTGLIEKST